MDVKLRAFRTRFRTRLWGDRTRGVVFWPFLNEKPKDGVRSLGLIVRCRMAVGDASAAERSCAGIGIGTNVLSAPRAITRTTCERSRGALGPFDA